MLDDPVDIIRCSAVNKTWSAACKTVQPRHLRVGHDNQLQPTKGVDYFMCWLITLNKAGQPKKIQNLMVCIDIGARERDQTCINAMLLLAHSWPLRCCQLQGPLHVWNLFGLPCSLRHLNLLHSDTGWIPPDYLMSLPELCTVRSDVRKVSARTESHPIHLTCILRQLTQLHIDRLPVLSSRLHSGS